MATLRIKFIGLCLWVPEQKRVTVLMPQVHQHSGSMPGHEARMLVPLKPNAKRRADFIRRDLTGMSVPLFNGATAQFDATVPRDQLAPIGAVANEKIRRGLLDDSDADLAASALASRVVLLDGKQLKPCNAPAAFNFNASRDIPLANIVQWQISVPSSSVLKIKLNSFDGTETDSVDVPADKVETGFFDVEIRYEPSSHFPWGNHTPSTPSAGLVAEHCLAYYGLFQKPERIELPVCTGASKARGDTVRVLGSDPVTCVQGSGDT